MEGFGAFLLGELRFGGGGVSHGGYVVAEI